jgi:hypothetical protein
VLFASAGSGHDTLPSCVAPDGDAFMKIRLFVGERLSKSGGFSPHRTHRYIP